MYTSGQLPTVDGALVATGKVGGDVTLEQAVEAARVAALNALAAAAAQAGGIDQIRRIVTHGGLCAPATPGSPRNRRWPTAPAICSARCSARSARMSARPSAVASLPLDAPVELELVVEASAAAF